MGVRPSNRQVRINIFQFLLKLIQKWLKKENSA